MKFILLFFSCFSGAFGPFFLSAAQIYKSLLQQEILHIRVGGVSGPVALAQGWGFYYRAIGPAGPPAGGGGPAEVNKFY